MRNVREKSPRPNKRTPPTNNQYARGSAPPVGAWAIGASGVASAAGAARSRVIAAMLATDPSEDRRLHRITSRKLAPRHTSTAATSGPITAPIMSALRSIP